MLTPDETRIRDFARQQARALGFYAFPESRLTIFAQTGAIREGFYTELESCRAYAADCDPGALPEWRAVARYVADLPYRGPVAGWGD